MQLSKSRYTQGVQCPKMLWMRSHMPEQFDESVMNQAVLDSGSAVGDVAMGYFGPYVEVPFDPEDPDRFDKAAQITRELIGRGEKVICEATFKTPGRYCMVDILRVRDDGSFDLVEVKSATKVHDIYYDDMAFQCWVVESCGYRVESVSLMHVDSRYVRHGELDLHGLFKVEDCTEEVFERARSVGERAEAMVLVADADEEPLQPIGLHCFSPYECGFRGWCFRELPQPNAFEIARLTKKRAFALVERGSAGFDELAGDAEAFSMLSPKQQLQVLAEVGKAGPQIDADAIRDFLDGLTYPLYFLDFETFQEGVPSFEGQRPYEQVTSQYSLHWVDSPDGELHHAEFLGETGADPRRAVAEHLCEDIPADACVLAWNMSFEKGRIKDMAELFPDLAERLLAIRGNIRDLIVPFQRGHYYLRQMQGSSSIKKVLPALFPDDPELDYHALDGVHNGAEAASAFQHLAQLQPDEQAAVREQLLRYCELDTLAMVKIWQKLREVAG